MTDSAYQHLALLLGTLIACAAALADVWHFHAFPIEVDGALLAAGLAGLGVKSFGFPPAR